MDASENKITTRSERKTWVDALRGLAMILVIFGHLCPSWTEFFVFTSPIKIPLFFAITGYLFNCRNGDFKQFIRSLFIKVIIPWFVLSLLPIKLIKAIFIDKSVYVLCNYIYKFISGTTLWYMPCCVLAEIFFFVILKYNKREFGVAISSVVIAMIGLLMAKYNLFSFAGINTAFIVQIFLFIGYWYKSNCNILQKYATIFGVSFGILFIVLGAVTLVVFPGQNLDVHRNSYYDILLCMIMIFVGCLGLFIISEKNNFAPKFLQYVGRNTLVFYMLNSYCIIFLRKMNLFIYKEDWISCSIMTLCICLLCAVLSVFINSFIPEIVGKRRKR